MAGGIGPPEEGLENIRDLFLFNTYPLVRDRNNGLIVLVVHRANDHIPSGKLDRIFQDITQGNKQ